MKITKLEAEHSMELLSIKAPTSKLDKGKPDSESGVFNGVRVGGDYITMWCDKDLYRGIVGTLNPRRPPNGLHTQIDMRSRLHYKGKELTRMDNSTEDSNVAVAIDTVPGARYTKAQPHDWEEPGKQKLVLEGMPNGGLKVANKPYKMIPEDAYRVMDKLREDFSGKEVPDGHSFMINSNARNNEIYLYVDTSTNNRITLDVS